MNTTILNSDIHFAATKCNKNGLIPPDVEFAFRDTDTIISGTQVTYTCLDDFVFINGDKFRVAYCDYETLEWVNVPTAGCVGELSLLK